MNEKEPPGGRRFFGIGVRPFLAPLALIVLSSAASLYPEPFLLDRAAVESGEIWRLWTGHFVHATRDPFVFDVGLGAFLFFFVRLRPHLLLLPPFVGLVVLGIRPEIAVYTGLSGVLHGLTALTNVELARSSVRWERVVATLLILGLLAKALTEALCGISLFTHHFDMGNVLFEAHLTGILGGLLLLLPTLGRRQGVRRIPAWMFSTCDAR